MSDHSPDPHRVVAGISCAGVLSALADYLEGALPRDTVAAVEAHLAGCEYCEKFGGEYATVVRQLKKELREPERLPDTVASRLWEAIDERR